MNNFGKNLALWIIIGVLLVALFNLFQGSTPRTSQYSLPYSDFLSEVDANRVNQVTIQGNTIGNAAVDGSGSAIGNCIRVNINGDANAEVSAIRPDIVWALTSFARGTRRYFVVSTVFGLIVAPLVITTLSAPPPFNTAVGFSSP